MPTIKGSLNATYFIDSIGKTYTFAKSYSGYDPDGHAIAETGRRNVIEMNGTAGADLWHYAVLSEGVNVRIEVGSSGVLDATGNAIQCAGVNASIINRGEISSSSYAAIRLDDAATNSRLVNQGKIDGGTAFHSWADGTEVINAKGAKMHSANETIVFLGTEGESFKLVNHGRIETAGERAILTVGSDDTIVNDGRIFGEIDLAAGNDTIDMRGGEIYGTISTGLGDDTLITNNAAHKLTELADQGFDTVRSSVTYTLSENVEALVLMGNRKTNATGNDLDNHLKGNKADNDFRGGGGLDTLTGGKGNDDFIFTTSDAQYVITDFENGHDRIGIKGYVEIDSFSDLAGKIMESGQDVLIDVSGRSILLQDTKLSEIDRHDFFFG